MDLLLDDVVPVVLEGTNQVTSGLNTMDKVSDSPAHNVPEMLNTVISGVIALLLAGCCGKCRSLTYQR
jgi:hypothetical protein